MSRLRKKEPDVEISRLDIILLFWVLGVPFFIWVLMQLGIPFPVSFTIFAFVWSLGWSIVFILFSEVIDRFR